MADVLQDKVAIVTGSGRGIGRGVAMLMAEEGAKVVVVDPGVNVDGSGFDQSVAEQVAAEIRQAGGTAVACAESVATMSGGEKIVQSAIDSFGKLDIVVTCAGIVRDRMIFNMSEEEWDDVIAVHLKGTFTVVKNACILFRQQRSGRIITFSSQSGLVGNSGQANYGAAKSGIAGFTKVVARDMGRHGVTANCIAPRAYTRMIGGIPASAAEVRARGGVASLDEGDEMQHLEPEGIAPFVCYLASDHAININAQPEVNRKENWALATMDAKGGLGPSAAMDAAHLAGDIADALGYGKVYVRDANHFGATCVYVEALTARGFAGRATCTSGAWMIPFGGDRIRLGTNPITWGVPCGEQPIVIDIAMTQRAVSPALRAAKAGEPLPPDYFMDEKMNPLEGIVSLETLIRGSVRPLGGERFGYKGSGLAILWRWTPSSGAGRPSASPLCASNP